MDSAMVRSEMWQCHFRRQLLKEITHLSVVYNGVAITIEAPDDCHDFDRLKEVSVILEEPRQVLNVNDSRPVLVY